MVKNDLITDISSDEEDTRKRKKTGVLVYKYKHGTVELHNDNLKCLEIGQYLQDSIIQFFGAYMVNEICTAETASRVHIFDTIFHKQLDQIFMEPEEGVDVPRLKQLARWCDAIDIFKKDFLIFPVCSKSHWFAMVVCYPANVRPASEFIEDPLKYQEYEHEDECQPAILVMDSLGPRQIGNTTCKVREFLDNNWRSRPGEPIKRFSHYDLPDCVVQLPKQNNTYDCGIYMLMYIRCLLEDPDEFYRSVMETGKPNADTVSRLDDDSLGENTRKKISTLITNFCDKA